jgi:ATP-dependent RNA helicase DDX60
MSVERPAAGGAAQEEEAPDSWDAEETSSDEETEQQHDVDDKHDAQSEISDDEDDDVEEDEPADQDQDSRILSLYRKLLSRRVDLVGDYAGDELFVIEGDSLLLRCFADERLDFDTGFQMLHAAYNVEHFLHNLVKRKCNFHIVFFDCNRELCVPPDTDAENASKFYLARAAIIRHLQANVASAQHGREVHVFENYHSEPFKAYLAASGPYFLAMHDGAQPENRKGKHINMSTETRSKTNQQSILLRAMILSFISRGYNIALLNGLEWRDTKVMTMVLESRHRAEAGEIRCMTSPQAGIPSIDVDAELKKLAGNSTGLSERQLLAVVAISKLVQGSLGAGEPQLCAAFLLHEALLVHLPLSDRCLAATDGAEGAQDLLRRIASTAEAILGNALWNKHCSDEKVACDVVDTVDGRLFLQLSNGPIDPTAAVKQTFESLISALGSLVNMSLPDLSASSSGLRDVKVDVEASPEEDIAVLPFSNPVFDKHLEPVHLKIDDITDEQESASSHRIFQELSHWHNAKRPLITKGPPTAASEKAAFWAAKRNQLFMAEMRTYAASLTNAVGKSLEPETIIPGGTVKPAGRDSPAEHGKAGAKKSAVQSPADSDASDSGASGKKQAPKKGGGGKNAKQNAGKQAMLASIAAAQAKKEESAGNKVVSAWHTVCKNIEADKDPRSRFRKSKDYITNASSTVRDVVEAEVRLYMLNCVLIFWIEAVRRKEKMQRIEITALIWDLCRAAVESHGLTKQVLSSVETTIKTLGLPAVPPASSASNLPDRKLGFEFALPTVKTDSLAVDLPSKDFQLTYCGPYLERSFDSRPDPRVEFNPDGWQRRVLDGIDANQSVFVVAPTSAGKTFISFYAMRKVLEADDEGVLVYVAPTKALVNQIAAEIQARYSKNFKYGGKSVWAIHTRDYRINNPTGCQVLVTVPHVLQIMLLAPSNANSWSSRVRRIIFDEVHSIGQAEDGVVWEQLLLMAPCPIIALSATVGNPHDFGDWLSETQKAIGIELKTIQHPYRYSDLRKYFYVPPKVFAFRGLPEKSAFGTLGLEGLTGFNFVHPVAALIDKSRGIPEDLGLEPRDCFLLYKAMKKHAKAGYDIPATLAPEKALPAVARKADVLQWEKSLKDVLRKWIPDSASPYDSIVKELETSFRREDREETYVTHPVQEGKISARTIHSREDPVKTTLPMLCRLHEQDALPAIVSTTTTLMSQRFADLPFALQLRP